MRIKTGRYLVRTRWFRVYWDGSFSMLEVDFGRPSRWELVIHLFTIRGIISVTLNEPLARMEKRIVMMVKNGEI